MSLDPGTGLAVDEVSEPPAPEVTAVDVSAPEVVAADVPEPDVWAPRAPGASRTSRTSALLIALSALLLLGLVTLLVFIALALSRASAADTRAAETRDATNAAVRDLPMFASYGYATIAADQKRAEAVFVPSLRSNYEKLFNPILQTLQQSKVIVTVVVQEAQAINVVKDDKVQVLVFFTQTTSSPTATSPTIKPFAYAMSMQKVKGTWLVAAVNATS
jgi:hypothetical protein